MNLKFQLLTRITTVGVLCLLAMVIYVLYNSQQQVTMAVQTSSETLSKQLQSQLLWINSGYVPDRRFPDFDLWQQTSHVSGICIRYVSAANNVQRGLCNGPALPANDRPQLFERIYRALLHPVFERELAIAAYGRNYGTLTVTASPELAIAKAWENIGNLSELAAITLFAVCLLVYLLVGRMLYPAQTIVSGLERLRQGDLSYRLPDFQLLEWQQTGMAINQLAANQQHLLAEQHKLAIKLINLQEEERRALARELHDEFGQSLAAIHAVAVSIAQTVETELPQLLDETRLICRFTQSMQDSVGNLLSRLRPAELSELGLEAGLRELVNRWNRLAGGKTRYSLQLHGDTAAINESQTLTLYRVTQEALTNIAKHAQASKAEIALTICADSVALSITDNGLAASLPFAEGSGIGLLGIAERIKALRGRFSLQIAQPHGLILQLSMPLAE